MSNPYSPKISRHYFSWKLTARHSKMMLGRQEPFLLKWCLFGWHANFLVGGCIDTPKKIRKADLMHKELCWLRLLFSSNFQVEEIHHFQAPKTWCMANPSKKGDMNIAKPKPNVVLTLVSRSEVRHPFKLLLTAFDRSHPSTLIKLRYELWAGLDSLNHRLFTRDDAILVTTTGNGDNLNHVSMKVPQHDMFTLQNKQILTFKLFLITSLHQLHLQFIVFFVWFLFRHKMYVYIYIHTWYICFLPNPTKTIPHNSLFLHQKKKNKRLSTFLDDPKETIHVLPRNQFGPLVPVDRSFGDPQRFRPSKTVDFQHVWSHFTLW